MTDSRAECLFVMAVLAVAVAVAWGAPAPAQQPAEPLRLKVPQQLKPVEADPAPSATAPSAAVPSLRSGYLAKPVGRAVSGIQVNRLDAVAADSAGVLTGGDGGLGGDLWQGSNLAFVNRLLAAHPERVSSQVLRRLLRRVLLSAATPPAGAEGVGFTAVRLRALLAMGDFDAGLDLLSAVPRHNRETAFLQLETELKLVTGKMVPACRAVGTEVTRRKSAFWQKALIFCQLLAGDVAKAEFGLSLLQETGVKDPLFVSLAHGMIAGQAEMPKTLDDAGLLHFAMLRAAKVELPMTTARRYPAALIQVAGDAGSDHRLEAIELAANDGLLVGDDLRERYVAAVPPAGSRAGDSDTVETARDRAHLYGDAVRSQVPTAKAEALRRAVDSAAQSGRLGGVARLFRPVLNAIPPTNDLLWAAPTAFRMVLLNGDAERAGAWLALARRHAALSPEAGTLYADLQPLAALLHLSDAAPGKPPLLPGREAAQVILFHGLFRALGGDVDLDAGDPLVFQADQTVPLSDPALWMRLRQLNMRKLAPPVAAAELATAPTETEPDQTVAVAAGNGPAMTVVDPAVVTESLAPPPVAAAGADGGRLGERILLLALAIGDRPLDAANPVVVEEVVHGLRQAGLPAEARALAMEIAISAGL